MAAAPSHCSTRRRVGVGIVSRVGVRVAASLISSMGPRVYRIM
jgi:hypothetical protein